MLEEVRPSRCKPSRIHPRDVARSSGSRDAPSACGGAWQWHSCRIYHIACKIYPPATSEICKISETEVVPTKMFSTANMNSSLIVEGLNIAELSDDELAERLKEQGFHPGPIIATTRSVYQRKLARLLRNETFIESFDEDAVDPEVRPSPVLSSTFRDFSPSYTSSPAFSANNLNIDYDDLRRRPLPRHDSSYSSSSPSTSYKPWSAADIVTQATPPPPEPEQPLLSPLVKLIALVCIILFVVFVYYNMESTPVNPFTSPPDASI